MDWPKFTLDAEQKDIKEVLQDKIKKDRTVLPVAEW